MTKRLTKEQIELLNKPLPKEALKAKPGAAGFTSINAIYVVDRLNAVFGVGCWTLKSDYISMLEEAAHNKNGEYTRRMPIVKVTFEVPEYDIHLECFGGNDNSDLGDAFKGGQTDALTKIGSWLGIGAGIWRGEYDHKTAAPAAAQKAKATKPAQEVAADTVDYETIVMDICSTNAAICQNVLQKFGVKTLDALSKEQKLLTYTQLKAKRII